MLISRVEQQVWRIAVCLVVAVASAAMGSAVHGARAGETTPKTLEDIEQVHVAIRGDGRVVSIPSGIECRSFCEQEFRRGTQVVLVAGSRPESRFAGWTGDCVGRSALCVVFADRTARVTATFGHDPDPDISLSPHAKYFVYVTGPRAGRGGTIRSERPAVGISCPRSCAKEFLNTTRITLRAYPARGYAPVWQSYPPGICSGNRCTVILHDADAHVAATFRRT